ncbi:MAG: hypothetical protein LBI14_05635 [Treponema sp.]|jgi:hypothetical protein|nr:hypothetical protein [Treponema sp.]
MMKSFIENANWSKLIIAINKAKPDYGTLTLDLTFHNSDLARASIKAKLDTVIFKKEDKNDRI